MAHQPQDVGAALLAHDRVRRSTDLPLFYGRKDKDTITARLLIDRIVTAAGIANWDDARKCQELYMILRDRAILWWNSLADTDIDRANWNALKTNFLACYEPRFTAKTTCTNFGELIQRTGEANLDYYLRVCEAFSKMCDARPEGMANVRAAAGAAAADIKMEGIRDAEKFFKHQLYLAGLREDLRIKVMEAGKATLQESMTLATELEVIHQDRKRGQIHAVSAVSTTPSDDVNEADRVNEDDITAEELEAINAIRQRQGRPAFRGNFRRNNNGNGPKKTVVCRYCRKPGHMQKECRARIRANGKMVDANGKPYEKKINAANTEETVAVEVKDGAGVGSIYSHAINTLNW